MPTSPDPLNYFVGKAIMKWKGALDADFRDLGNCPSFEMTPQVQRLQHFSSREGVRRQDFNPVASQTMTVKFHLEEFTSENLALVLMGSMVAGPPDVIQIMDQSEVTGALRLVGTNDIGERKQIDLPNVNIAPSAAMAFIGDTYGFLEVTGEVYADPTTGSFGTVRNPITGEILL